MKTEQPLLITSIKASTDLNKNLFVGFDGNLPVANSKPLGVVNADTGAGNMCPVAVAGIVLVKTGSAVQRGSAVTANASGKAVPVLNFTVSVPQGSNSVLSNSTFPTLLLNGGVLPQSVAGYALDDASGADQLIRVLLT